jgi:hypothetical protein
MSCSESEAEKPADRVGRHTPMQDRLLARISDLSENKSLDVW